MRLTRKRGRVFSREIAMNTKEEALVGRGYAFINPATTDGAPFPAVGALLGSADATRCEELARLAQSDPYAALSETSGNTLSIVKWDFIDEEFPWAGCQIIQRIDAADFLCRYARRAALLVADYWSPPQCVRKFLESGDLASALSVVNTVRIRKRKGCKDEQIYARGAARFAAIAALLAYKESDERLRKDAAAMCGKAIHAADAIRQDVAQHFNDRVLQHLAGTFH
jgi:hypothetical protein